MKSLARLTKYLAVGIGILIGTPSSFSADFALPTGWRSPVASELSDDWHKEDPEKFAVVRGDFNGDGVVDTAMLLVSLRGRGLGLFAFLSQLDAIKDASYLEVMGIGKVSPGKEKTACGKEYWECGKKSGEVPEILIKHDAIDYFQTGSANSYFYWDERAKIFRRIWISD